MCLLSPPRYVADIGSFRIAQVSGEMFSCTKKMQLTSRMIPILYENTSLGACTVIGRVYYYSIAAMRSPEHSNNCRDK